jgi:hypothetical protein
MRPVLQPNITAPVFPYFPLVYFLVLWCLVSTYSAFLSASGGLIFVTFCKELFLKFILEVFGLHYIEGNLLLMVVENSV